MARPNAVGELTYLPNALGIGAEAPPITLIEFAEDSTPDSITFAFDVAGFVNGSVIVGDRDQLFAVTAPGSLVGPIATGDRVQASPDGTLLAASTEEQITVFDIATGEGYGLMVDEPNRAILDLEWIDDSTLATMTYVDGDDDLTYDLARYDAATLARSTDVVSFESPVRFAGRTADGLLAVQGSASGTANVRYYDASLAEQPDLEQTFTSPTPIQFIEIDPSGLGQIWVDEFRLFYLGSNQFEARLIDTVVSTGWWVTPS